MIVDALRLSVYFGESVASGHRLAGDVLMDLLDGHGVRVAVLLRGIEGFGLNRRIQAERLPEVSTDLPLVAVAVDERDRIAALLDDVDRAVPRGLVTLERVLLATGGDVAAADFPAGAGQAGELTVFCAGDDRAGRRPAHREVVSLLRRHGASGAIVLPGVDGRLRGRRLRARLFTAAPAPFLVGAVGPREPLRQSLRAIAEALPEAVATLEPVAQVKHDGERLEPLPSIGGADGGPDVWQAVRVITRRTAQVGGRALFSEMTHRVRETGGAGITTVQGDWGFSSDEEPHGDKLGRVASHRPTSTIVLDRPAALARLWPLIDEATAEHGIVVSGLVPGYRERAGATVHGDLAAVLDQAR